MEFYKGEAVEIPLYLFDLNADPRDVILNFDPRLPVDREDRDPEFLLQCRGYSPDMVRPPADWGQAKSIIRKVMAGHWGALFFSRQLISWKGLLEREEVKNAFKSWTLYNTEWG